METLHFAMQEEKPYFQGLDSTQKLFALRL